jgi:DNA-binding NarL/FixJ family response regulator
MPDNDLCDINVLIDQLITSDYPNLQLTARHKYPDMKFDSFDFLSSTRTIGAALDRAWPDIVLVDRVWLHLSTVLNRLLISGDHSLPRIVIASPFVDEVFQAQMTHRGFTDYIDLGVPADVLAAKLCEIHRGRARYTDNRQWASVPLPSMANDLSHTPHDDFDRQILGLVCVGMQDADIACVVHLSTQTVKNRISAMLDRSGLRNRTQLAWMQANQSMGDAMSRTIGHRGLLNDNSTAERDAGGHAEEACRN